MWWANGLHENSPIAPSTWNFALPLYPKLSLQSPPIFQSLHPCSTKMQSNVTLMILVMVGILTLSWTLVPRQEKLHVIVLLMGVIIYVVNKTIWLTFETFICNEYIWSHAFKISWLDIKVILYSTWRLIIHITRFVFMLFFEGNCSKVNQRIESYFARWPCIDVVLWWSLTTSHLWQISMTLKNFFQ